MNFDWERAIERNFDAIERIVAGLYALAGITSLRPVVETLPRHLRIRILAILRPAEFAARRLIAMAACARSHALPPVREPIAPPTVAKPAPSKGRPSAEPPPAFALFDPFKPWLTPEEIAALENPDHARWIPAALPPDEPVAARALCRRIAALRHALDDLDGQALRLARWRARRSAEASSCSGLTRVRPKRWMPMRPGRPPGWAKRPKTDVADVLKECDLLARRAWENPDTS